jgi:hypothetical protein
VNNHTLAQAVGGHNGMKSDGDHGLTYNNLKLTFKVSSSSLLLVAHQGAPATMLLAPESDYTRKAESLGVSDESKIGSSAFDQKYVIRDTGGKAKDLLTPQVVAMVEALEPFTELELCDDMIRLLKKPSDEASAVQDLEILAKLSQAFGPSS